VGKEKRGSETTATSQTCPFVASDIRTGGRTGPSLCSSRKETQTKRREGEGKKRKGQRRRKKKTAGLTMKGFFLCCDTNPVCLLCPGKRPSSSMVLTKTTEKEELASTIVWLPAPPPLPMFSPRWKEMRPTCLCRFRALSHTARPLLWPLCNREFFVSFPILRTKCESRCAEKAVVKNREGRCFPPLRRRPPPHWFRNGPFFVVDPERRRHP